MYRLNKSYAGTDPRNLGGYKFDALLPGPTEITEKGNCEVCWASSAIAVYWQDVHAENNLSEFGSRNG